MKLFQEIILKIRYFERGFSKSLKKASIPFNGQSYQKQKGPGTSNQSLFRLQNKFRKIPLLVIYYLTMFDDITLSSFRVVPKITSANLCKPIHDIINYSTSIWPFEVGKCERKGKNYKNLNISRTKRVF